MTPPDREHVDHELLVRTVVVGALATNRHVPAATSWPTQPAAGRSSSTLATNRTGCSTPRTTSM
jgi:hypothetical protein